MLRIALITNHPPPFRIPVYDRIAAMPNVDLHVIFCSAREPNRQWELPPLRFQHVFLKERFVARGSNFIHNNPDVLSALRRISPDVIVTTGFNPTYLYAFAYALAKGIPHVPMTDGTDASEHDLSRWHRLIRRLVYARSQAFIAASQGGIRLYEAYGVAAEHCFRSCLCIDNDAYQQLAPAMAKKYDLVFCGRIVHAKNPLFAIDVARRAAGKLGRKVSILFVGSGEQEPQAKALATEQSAFVDAHFHGHASQDELPALYGSARVFLFPTMADVWGVVANEACAAALPIIVSPHSGAAGELIVHGENGFICELDAEQWAEHVAGLLTNEALYTEFSRKSMAISARYTFESASIGVVDACRHAVAMREARRLKELRGKAS